jgi:hypothetical protein
MCCFEFKNKRQHLKTWTNGSCEGLVMAMHDVVLSSNINIVQGANLFLVTANEVTNIMDNQQWINVYVYVIKDYQSY